MTLVKGRSLAPTRRVLSGGMVLLAKENRTIPAVTIHAAFHAGSVYEPARTPGLAFFISRTLDRGTKMRAADEIADELDARGVTLNVSVNRHTLSLVCTVLTEDFETVLSVIGDIAASPVFPEKEVEIRRREIATLIRQDEDNPAAMAVETLLGTIYPDNHPYGRRLKGSLSSVAEVTRPDLLAFHAARSATSSLTIAIVGAIEPARGADAVERAFASVPLQPLDSSPPLPPLVTPPTRRRVVVPMMNKMQADIAYGFVGPKRLDPDYYAYWIMNNILGQYGMGGRLGDKIRERQGMAYYAFSALEANVEKGPLVIRAGVNPINVDRTIEIIDQEVARMAADGPTAKELAETKQYLTGSIPRMLETNADIATFLQTAEFFGLGLDYDARLPELIAEVTLEETHAAARALLDPSRAAVAIAGPYTG